MILPVVHVVSLLDTAFFSYAPEVAPNIERTRVLLCRVAMFQVGLPLLPCSVKLSMFVDVYTVAVRPRRHSDEQRSAEEPGGTKILKKLYLVSGSGAPRVRFFVLYSYFVMCRFS